MTHCSKWMATLLGASFAISTGTYANAVVFTHGYEGDHLPQDPLTSPQWTKVLDSGDEPLHDPNETSESASGGILTVNTTNNAAYIEYRLDAGAAWNPSGNGSTLEFQLKTDFNTAGSDWAGTFLVSVGSRYWVLAIGENFVSDIATGGDLLMTTDDKFHIYRLTIDDEVNGPLNLYVDGATTPAKTWAGVAGAANRLGFGDLTGNESGQIQWDYIRWTNEGAFAPVPEPSMLSLAAVGALALLRRRRACRD